jgi:TorA maturation chaperone TorD
MRLVDSPENPDGNDRSPRRSERLAEANALDEVRARCWALVGLLLTAPPSAQLLDVMGRGDGPPGDDACSRGARRLFETARVCDTQDVARTHMALFGAGSDTTVDLRASHWLDSDRLCALQRELRTLRLQGPHDARDARNHLGALCEGMSQIARRGDDTGSTTLALHLLPWAWAAMAALRMVAFAHQDARSQVGRIIVRGRGNGDQACGAASTAFYVALADFTLAFFDNEARLLGLEAS